MTDMNKCQIKARICKLLKHFDKMHYLEIVASFTVSHQLDALDVLIDMYTTGHIMSRYGNACLVVPDPNDIRQEPKWYREIIESQIRHKLNSTEKDWCRMKHPLHPEVNGM